MKYFFDRVHIKNSQYDYQGKVLHSREAARELAELMAMDLEVDEEENWAGWAISVRDSLGQQLFSVPVGATAR